MAFPQIENWLEYTCFYTLCKTELLALKAARGLGTSDNSYTWCDLSGLLEWRLTASLISHRSSVELPWFGEHLKSEEDEDKLKA